MEEQTYVAYAIENWGTEDEQFDIVAMTDVKELAEMRIQQAMASGFDCGYIERGNTVIETYDKHGKGSEVYYQVYAVKNKGQENEQSELLGFAPTRKSAEMNIRLAIASGFDCGYIKQGTTVVKSYNESSFDKKIVDG